MDEQRSEAFLLRSVEYGEADRIVTFLTADAGKLTLFARGARRSRRRFGGTLEPFQRLQISFNPGRRGLAWLQDAQLLATRPRLMEDYDRILCASYVTELVNETMREAEPLPELFDLLEAAYSGLDSKAYAAADPGTRMGWLAVVELTLLARAGYQPILDGCTHCGEESAERFQLNPKAGGLLCEAHAPSPGHGLLAAETVRRLAAGLRPRLPGPEGCALELEQARAARRALGLFIRHHLGKELKSARFVRVD